jgi:hypothetical protein
MVPVLPSLPYAGGVTDISLYILRFLALVSGLTGAFAFVHALMHRPDAFRAADKASKPKWVALTGGGTLASLGYGAGAGIWFLFLLWIAGLIAILVYVVDVRGKVREIQRGAH